MNYLIDEYQRNVLLEYFEEREDLNDDGTGPNEAMHLASMLRDLKALKEVAA